MPTATALDAGQLARPAPSLTHTPEDAQVSVPSVSVSRKDSRDREP